MTESGTVDTSIVQSSNLHSQYCIRTLANWPSICKLLLIYNFVFFNLQNSFSKKEREMFSQKSEII